MSRSTKAKLTRLVRATGLPFSTVKAEVNNAVKVGIELHEAQMAAQMTDGKPHSYQNGHKGRDRVNAGFRPLM